MKPVDVTRLSDITLEDHEGNPHRLGEYWATQAVVLNFLRHFG